MFIVFCFFIGMGLINNLKVSLLSSLGIAENFRDILLQKEKVKLNRHLHLTFENCCLCSSYTSNNQSMESEMQNYFTETISLYHTFIHVYQLPNFEKLLTTCLVCCSFISRNLSAINSSKNHS